MTSCSIPCDLCGGADVDAVGTSDRDGAPLRTVICRRCGLAWSDPRPTPDDIHDYYERTYRLDYKATWQPRPKHLYRAGKVAVERVRGLTALVKAGARVLDCGAGGGEVVYVLRAMGYQAEGIEPNEGYARHAREVLGVPVTQGFYQTAWFEPESYDAVTMFHVVEHLESPTNALRRVREWLRPDGLLWVEVPNIEAVCQWPSNRFHRAHLYSFNLATLGMTGSKAGFVVASTMVSPDGGNITVALRKGTLRPAAQIAIPGSCDRVCAIIRRHTPIRHLLSRYPYIRPIRKLLVRFDERRHVRSGVSPRGLLDGLISAVLKPTNSPPAVPLQPVPLPPAS